MEYIKIWDPVHYSGGEYLFKRKWILLLSAIIILSATGCSIVDKYIRIEDKQQKEATGENQESSEEILTIDPEPQPQERVVTLYFKHKYFDYLVPETRKVIHDRQTYEQLVVEELMKGPTAHDRVSIMPSEVKVLDVSQKGETVFVNLSEEFNNPIDLTDLYGKADIPEEKKSRVQAEMKRLAIYSIVNTLTELDGVNQVKILVNNKAIGYQEMGQELMQLMNIGEQSPSSTVLVALYRNRNYILSPADSVRLVFEGLVGEPKWDQVYSLLASETMSHKELPSKEELQKLWPALINSLELEQNFIIDEEIKPDGRAFVTASYTVNYASGTKEKKERDLITVENENGIWKVKMPEFMENIR